MNDAHQPGSVLGVPLSAELPDADKGQESSTFAIDYPLRRPSSAPRNQGGTMSTASGTLDVDFSDETFDDRDGTQLARRRLRKVFTGDIDGESHGEFLLAIAPDGAAAYVGLDRVTATIAGRSGNFVLVHNATRSRTSESASISVLVNSATAGLQGLRGDMTIAITPAGAHTYTFDYDINGS
jgi:hypothetical protein